MPYFDGLVGGFARASAMAISFPHPMASRSPERGEKQREKRTATCEPFPIRTEFNGRNTEFVAFQRVLDPVVWPSGTRGGFCPRKLFGFYECGIGSGHGESCKAVGDSLGEVILAAEAVAKESGSCGSAKGMYFPASIGVLSVTERNC